MRRRERRKALLSPTPSKDNSGPPTSPIITTGATAIRAKDDLTKLLASIPFNGVNDDTLYAKFLAYGANGDNQYPVEISNSAGAERFGFRIDTTNNIEAVTVISGDTSVIDSGVNVSYGTDHKMALAGDASNRRVSCDGATAVTDANGGGGNNIAAADKPDRYRGRTASKRTLFMV